tara:strand:+ start:59 stop:334 length:276 start_codon:yes stop_codon:yes gene_type:complete
MPRQIFEINGFHLGITSNPEDELDIPNDAATISLNVDPLNEGELKGIPDNQYLKTSGFLSSFSDITYTKPSVHAYSPGDTEDADTIDPSSE